MKKTMKKTIFEGNFSQEGKPLADEQQSLSAKAPYEAPVTTRTLVETEGSFCASEPIKDDQTSDPKAVEVEEYISIEDNNISFD